MPTSDISTKAPETADEAAKAARSDARTTQLLRAATEVMQERGAHATSMKLVAERAGVSVGLIYRYYANKDELVQAVITGVLDQMAIEVPASIAPVEDPVRRVAAGFTAYAEVIRDNRAATLLTYRETGQLGPQARETVKQLELKTGQPMLQATREAIAAGYFRPMDARTYSYDLLIAAHSWALKHWYYTTRMSFETFVKTQISIHLYAGLKPAYYEAYSDLLLTDTIAD
ncbi:TetR/AcrR family transcriptional regulator [Corynebacterium guangdongense]|uniref:AcrR family transcriptional regulator n=1 Tax=Corynebacterium guangdongense TaxID=1783348 RepID=A0ABU1ZTX3_9CORY|nr:TetR/AcrR family transcriptional regulator [Corynebacterium guangdongense]MDR7328379.1 AcrR family transcriptional regulator [Corynebacterium guangdongense]WJZ16956.1 HTH-type transcriptional repressor KstR2 [Corynebacterium guangdongense]